MARSTLLQWQFLLTRHPLHTQATAKGEEAGLRVTTGPRRSLLLISLITRTTLTRQGMLAIEVLVRITPIMSLRTIVMEGIIITTTILITHTAMEQSLLQLEGTKRTTSIWCLIWRASKTAGMRELR